MEGLDGFVLVGRADELANGERKVIFLGTKRVALFRIEDEFYCIHNACPHAGGSLGHGEIDGCGVRCPRHDWLFDLKTGACRTDPRYEATTYAVRVVDGEVFVRDSGGRIR